MIGALSDADIEILTAFAENDMNVTKTAKQQYRCRGNIIYHLNKGKECTGLNPLKFYDLVRLLELCGVNAKGERDEQRENE